MESLFFEVLILRKKICIYILSNIELNVDIKIDFIGKCVCCKKLSFLFFNKSLDYGLFVCLFICLYFCLFVIFFVKCFYLIF